jgi:hypothetical protein
MPPSFPPREEKQGHLPTEEVMTMMRSFQRMTDALTNRLDREASGALNHGKGAQHTPNASVYRDLEKVSFPKFWGGWRSS